MVIEGVFATQAAYRLGRRLNLEMPLTESLNRVMFEHADTITTLQEMMGRMKKHEYEDLAFDR